MTGIDDIEVTRAIVERFNQEFTDRLHSDVVVAGAGPSGLVAAMRLAQDGHKVTVFERKLSPGGGMWGGGMTFPVIVVQKESKRILDEVGAKSQKTPQGYYTVDSIESVCKLCSSAIDAGARIFNTISIEDVMMKGGKRINGAVINWSAVEIAGLHVDPLTVGTKAIIDATGHAAEVCKIVQRKAGVLNTPSGGIEGERSMWAEAGERTVVENTKEVFPGLFVAGMAANAVYGAPRMGPIFGGMLLSGEKVARMVSKSIRK
ncbi:MAG: sulfide-dependent adenosine diphosphate thiazole synthase [Methanobacteriota archaeon]